MLASTVLIESLARVATPAVRLMHGSKQHPYSITSSATTQWNKGQRRKLASRHRWLRLGGPAGSVRLLGP
jgi:hypothetical protein